jgi:AraC family transcriptional regulator
MVAGSSSAGAGEHRGLAFEGGLATDRTPAYVDKHADRAPALTSSFGIGAVTSLKATFWHADRGEFSVDGDPQFLSLVEHSGGARVWSRHSSSPVESGAMGMDPFEGASWYYEGPVSTACFYIPFGLLNVVSESLFGREFRHDHVEIPLATRHAALARAMRVLKAGFQDAMPSDLVLDSWALILADTVVRNLSYHARRHSGERLGKLPARGMALVVSFVEANIDQDLRLEALAGIAGMSTYHFARRFKETTGVSPHAYVLLRRIRRAESLLLDPAVSLAEIAAACGFSSQAHFTTAFRLRLGTTPHAYRRNAAL